LYFPLLTAVLLRINVLCFVERPDEKIGGTKAEESV
jgi:hypothetical protein